MNSNFTAFVGHGRALAAAKGVNWDIRVDSNGKVVRAEGWNLTMLSGDSPPPTIWVQDFGSDPGALGLVNMRRAEEGRDAIERRPLSRAWQDFIKACICDQLFVCRNTPAHVAFSVVRPFRVLATCVGDHEPWELTTDDVVFAVETATRVQKSGKLGDLVFGLISNVLDGNHIADNGPLSLATARSKKYRGKRSKFAQSSSELRAHPESRKRNERLPERRAFWELTRIVFTERPRSFVDVLRFALVRVLLLTGLRVGEAVRIPADWKHIHEYYDAKGRPAGELGGFSRGLSVRHFAEKNRTAHEDSVALFEDKQHVPPMFEEILTSTLDQILEMTTPLRNTLKRQIETGRILPEFAPRDLVPLVDLYVRLTGNPFIANLEKETQDRYVAAYRGDFQVEVLEKLHLLQTPTIASVKQFGLKSLDPTFYTYANRFPRALLRKSDGSRYSEKRRRWNSVYVRVGELEHYLASNLASKRSDSTPLKLLSGDLKAWELMFLMPKRALSEGRNDGMCDVTRYCAVGRVDANMITDCISGESNKTLFSEYGQDDEDRRLQLNPHQLRHLQNTELLAKGLADSIVTKRFNRRTITQTYEYDHRSLAEELDQHELDPEAEMRLGPKPSTVVRMIRAGKASGTIPDEYLRIQRDEGEDAAFDYIKVEADGFHSTPFGHCLQNFTTAPCPKHLECFAGCRHLSATNLPENRQNLIQLENRLSEGVESIESRDSESIGRANQLAHARARLEGVRKLLSTPANEQVFPDGVDFSQLGSQKRRSVLDVKP